MFRTTPGAIAFAGAAVALSVVYAGYTSRHVMATVADLPAVLLLDRSTGEVRACSVRPPAMSDARTPGTHRLADLIVECSPRAASAK